MTHQSDGVDVACETCLYWSDTEDGYGWCRKSPPTTRDGDNAPEASWPPITDVNDWCGSWSDARKAWELRERG